MKFILASASERRKELLGRIINEFKIIVSDFDETSINFQGHCGEYVKELALGKINAVSKNVIDDCVIIGCDTIVYHNGEILGKPKDEKDAYKMLQSLSGTSHKVYSGIAVKNTATNEIKTDYVCTEVYFSEISSSQINEYIETNEPMDKAGAYGIQGYGGIFVEKIIGCYYNVVGLPLNKLYNMLREMGVNL
ncbi:septum formation protein Maf [Clostridiales bacterium oral taxon 876 str. F0540]|nr:septum formation protein Maf [Clostridiales bacterium oral taxon 876 str. F0540]